MTFWQFAFKNVSRNSKAYFAYFVSSAFSIMVFFSFTVYAYHPRLQSVQSFQERDPLMNLASTAQLVIVMFSFFFLLYSIGTFLNVRKQQFGVLTVLGISQKQLKRLLFTENMIIGMLAIFAGIQGGLVFSNFFLLVTSKLTSAKRPLFILANRSYYRYNRNFYYFIFHRIYVYTNVYSYSKNNAAY